MTVRAQSGLTLIEILVILLVILTLTALAVPPLLNARTRAEVARVQQDLQVVESAVEWYFMDHKKYPETPSSTSLSGQSTREMGLQKLIEPVQYLDSTPVDRFRSSVLVQGSDPIYEFGSGGNPKAGKYVPAWIIVSAGPDGVINSRNLDTFPLGSIVEEYSPTNGIRSEGDIVRYGGHYGDGDWFLNGRRVGSAAP